MSASGKKRVCVIGAGAAGLAAIRHINASQTLEGVVFEASGNIGGTWKYSEQIGVEFSSPMYKGLKTNLPKQIMGFLDVPMTNGKTSFITHDQVLDFLNTFADNFQLRQNIQLNTQVLCVQPLSHNEVQNIAHFDNLKWKIDFVISGNKDEPKSQVFDAVIVCNGHFNKPQIPKVVLQFQGEILHSKNYRVPEHFLNKKVLVLGCGPSGVDIVLEIVDFTTQVTLSMKNPPFPGHLPEKIVQKSSIRDVQGTRVTFEDGSWDNFDVILICTGYEYELPFLHPECGLRVEEGKFVTPLYRHLINISYPSMALVGLPFRICPFLLFDSQVRYFIRFLEGGIVLPSKEQMLETLEKEKKYREENDIPFRRSHELQKLQWPYMRELGAEAGFTDLLNTLPLVKDIYDKVGERRKNFPALYKNDEITFRGNNLCIVEHLVCNNL